MTVETKTAPDFDLEYQITDFIAGTTRDSTWLYDAIEGTMADLATEVPGGRVLDVACGTGKVAMQIAARGCRAIGAEASADMIGLGRYVQPDSRAEMVRSIAEELPFGDATFDRVICQGSLDHFVDGRAFMREAARVTRPDGRVVIALANFESISCRVGRRLDTVKWRLGRKRPPWRKYWETPEDHNVRGDLPYVRSLGGDWLELDRCFGISLLWLMQGYGAALDKLPEGMARRIWSGLDRAARGRPRHADMIISVWRKPGAHAWPAR
jgi:SAM-dependent methyltransferase